MELHHISKAHAEGQAYFEFLRTVSLSAGVYRLAAGAADAQLPHTEDEVYLLLAGRCRLRAGDKDVPVEPGDVLFVPAGEPHQFHDLTEAIEVLVFFAPAEGLRQQTT